jgi:hypothetical protein
MSYRSSRRLRAAALHMSSSYAAVLRPALLRGLAVATLGLSALAPASALAQELGGPAAQPTNAAPAAQDAVDTDAADALALTSWPGISFGWDVHAEAVSMFKHYTIGERGAWYSGQGAGGGATASLHFRPPAALSGSALNWIEFELGVGNSTHFVRWEEGERARPHTDFVDNQTSAIIALHVATGRWTGSRAPWSGAVLGLAWMPTYVHFFGNDDFVSGGKFHHAGLRVSVDWGRVSPTAKGRVPGLRAFLTWLPYIGSLPTAVSAGVGCVFY